ncbi:MAG: outer membrane integrity protein, partial [Sphingobacteriia bacterium]
SGLVEMPTDDIRMDLKFATTHTGFKQLLSLVPAMYTQDFDKLEADGSLAFSGYARGVYNDTQYPAFNVKMQVKNGSFHYPDLPAKVTDIQVDAEVNSPGADLEQMQIQVRRLHANLAGNPLDAHLLMKGLTNAYYEAGLKARLNLKTLATFYPIEGLSLAGELALDARVKGRVEEEKLPNMQVVADMKYGYLKSNDFPAAIENLNFHAELTNTEGTLQAM